MVPEHVQAPVDSSGLNRRRLLFPFLRGGTSNSSETSHKEPRFHRFISERWISFANRRLSRRTLLRTTGRYGLTAFASSLVVAGMHPEQTELGVNWLLTTAKAPDAPLTIPETAEAKTKKAMHLYNNMITRFGTYNEFMLEEGRDTGESMRYAVVWPYTRAIDATFAMGLVKGAGHEPIDRYKRMLSGLEGYWNELPLDQKPGYDPGLTALNSNNIPLLRPFSKPQEPDRYVDDNLWIAHLLMREYWESKDKRLLHRAKQVFELAVSQWDSTDGGVFWKQQFPNEKAHGRGMVSNAPAIMLGIDLYKAFYAATGDQKCLEFCDNTYTWIQENLKDTSKDRDGLYFDNKDYTGVIGEEKHTYNQGTMIGAIVRLHEIDPDRYQLDEAVKLATDSLDYFHRNPQGSRHRRDPEEGLAGYENTSFTGIYFANLLYLSTKLHNPEFTQRVQSTLRERVNQLRPNYTNLLDQAGAVHLAALNCVEEKDYDLLYRSPLFIGA